MYWLTQRDNDKARALYDRVATDTGFVHYEIDLRSNARRRRLKSFCAFGATGESSSISLPHRRAAGVDDRADREGEARCPSSATRAPTRHVKRSSLRSPRSSVMPPMTP